MLLFVNDLIQTNVSYIDDTHTNVNNLNNVWISQYLEMLRNKLQIVAIDIMF